MTEHLSWPDVVGLAIGLGFMLGVLWILARHL